MSLRGQTLINNYVNTQVSKILIMEGRACMQWQMKLRVMLNLIWSRKIKAKQLKGTILFCNEYDALSLTLLFVNLINGQTLFC